MGDKSKAISTLLALARDALPSQPFDKNPLETISIHTNDFSIQTRYANQNALLLGFTAHTGDAHDKAKAILQKAAEKLPKAYTARNISAGLMINFKNNSPEAVAQLRQDIMDTLTGVLRAESIALCDSPVENSMSHTARVSASSGSSLLLPQQ